MRYARTLFFALALAGCAAQDIQRPPVTPLARVTPEPTPPTSGAPTAGGSVSGVIWVMVVDPTGVCIEAATVQVVSGQGVGPSVVQDAECDAWSSSGGILFDNLTPGVEMTIRATTPSGRVQEQTVLPSVGSYSVTLFTPR
jgi:hypothetical protein